MNPEQSKPAAGLAEELRRSFDASFAEGYRAEAVPPENFIAIRVADHPYAIALADMAGLFAGKAITPVPGDSPGLLGVASFRGAIVPVFDLRTLLGYSGGQVPRWLVLVLAQPPVSLAFDEFEGHLRAARTQVITVDGTPRPVLDLPSILDEIGKRTSPPQREGGENRRER